MEEINRFLDNYFAGKNYRILKKFESKKNAVFLLEVELEGDNSNLVLKRYYRNNKKEAAVLHRLREEGSNVPAVHYQDNQYLMMEYLPGPTLLEYLSHQEEEKADITALEPVVSNFTSWIDGFYRIYQEKGLIIGDINFRNFIIVDPDQIYGIDFEDCRKGPVEMDIGRICAYGITYLPAFTRWKQKLVRYLYSNFVSCYKIDKDLTGRKYREELNAIQDRRDLSIPGEIYKLI